jgi:16S rRNA C1402 (ribose-2'-O) methylase RsmI
MIDTGKLSDLKEELYQLCEDVDKLITDTSDEAKAQEVANSLDEIIEQAGECVMMLSGEEEADDTDAQLREAAGLPPAEAEAEEDQEEEAEEEEIPQPIIDAHDAIHAEMGDYEGDHDHVGIEDGVHKQLHDMTE